jgi:cupin 2 domain-containing protein
VEVDNIFDAIPEALDEELATLLVQQNALKIERIVSRGHTSPESGWYDQERHEWVIVLEGRATITLEGETELHLKSGSYVNIPAHTKHKVTMFRE